MAKSNNIGGKTNSSANQSNNNGGKTNSSANQSNNAGVSPNTLTVYSASAGTGKTYTLASRYIALLLDNDDPYLFRHILAVTFTNKATEEMKHRILSYLYIIAEGNSKTPGRKQFIDNLKNFLINKKIITTNDKQEMIVNKKQNGVASSNQNNKKTGQEKPETDLKKKARKLYHNILQEYQNMRVTTIDSFLQTLLVGMVKMADMGADFNVEMDLKHVISTAVDQVMQLQTAPGDTATPTSGAPKDKYSILKILADYVNEQLEEEKSWDVRKSIIQTANTLFSEAVLSNDENIEFDPARLDYIKNALKLNWRNAECVKDIEKEWEKVNNEVSDGLTVLGKNYNGFFKRIGNSLHDWKNVKTEDMFKPLTKKQEDDINKDINNNTLIKNVVKNTGDHNLAQTINNAFKEMNRLCPDCRKLYLEWKVLCKFLSDLKVMKFVNNNIRENLREANCILMARTAHVISKALEPGDADFILEKAGINYQYLMIDEFQDTSTMQWKIFHQLMKEILGAGGYALVVGDIKQSIYRWRNGDYRIMQDLLNLAAAQRNKACVSNSNSGVSNSSSNGNTKNTYNVERQDLQRNFRSEAEVVAFNLGLFNNLIQPGEFAEHFKDIYKEGANGYDPNRLEDYHNHGNNHRGYVEVDVWGYSKGRDDVKKLISLKNVQRQATDYMLETIDDLINKGMPASDILILVRKNFEAMSIANQFMQYRQEHEQSALAQQNIRLINSDSFRLDSSPSVQTIINALKYINHRDDIAKEYLLLNDYNLKDIESLKRDMPLNELTEAVVHLLLCDAKGKVKVSITDISYINCLMDEIHNYVNRYGSDLKGLLTYWDDNLSAKTIPSAGSEGIRLMTIHTAKGLEGKTVFVPFCSWPLMESDNHKPTLWVNEPQFLINKIGNGKDVKQIPVEATNSLEEIQNCLDSEDQQKYDEELKANKVDNLNLLYVALTRAEANLYIYTYINDAKTKDSDTGHKHFNNIGEVLLSGLNNGQKMVDDTKKDIKNWGDDKGRQFVTGTNNPSPKPTDLPREEWHTGQVLIGQKGGTGLDTPFEHTYKKNEYQRYSYHTADTNFCFRQSQEALRWMLQSPENAKEAMDSIHSGTVRHDIFSHIATMADSNAVVDDFRQRGLIDPEEEEAIKKELERAWQNEKMKDWFSGKWELMREVSILRPESEYNKDMALWKQTPPEKRGPMPKRELRPDRVMLRGNEAVVLDFKFGKHNDAAYAAQVRRYMSLLQEMGYQNTKGWLWYGYSGELVEVAGQ